MEVGAVAIDPFRQIVVIGWDSGGHFGGARLFLARYTRRGTIDRSFGERGYTRPTFVAPGEWSSSGDVIALQDGRLVAGGSVTTRPYNTEPMFALARLNAAGAFDTTFDGDGRVATGFGTAGARLEALALDTAGRYVAAGYASHGTDGALAVARYREDGSLDPEFGGTGQLTTQLPGSCAMGFDAAVQRDDKTVVAGRVDSCDAAPRALIVRYAADGQLDTTFGGDGIVTAKVGTETVATALVLDAHGRPVVAVNSSRGPRLLRFTASGARDLEFGRRGRSQLPKRFTMDAAGLDLVRQPDGKLLAAGTTLAKPRRFLLLRFLRNGGIDRTFGRDGSATIRFGRRTASASALAMQGTGRAVVGGTVGDYVEELALTRVWTDPRR